MGLLDQKHSSQSLHFCNQSPITEYLFQKNTKFPEVWEGSPGKSLLPGLTSGLRGKLFSPTPAASTPTIQKYAHTSERNKKANSFGCWRLGEVLPSTCEVLCSIPGPHKMVAQASDPSPSVGRSAVQGHPPLGQVTRGSLCSKRTVHPLPKASIDLK